MRQAKVTSNIAFLLLAIVAPLIAQEIQIRVRVNEVVVPFSVRDSDGRLVPGLTEEDFTVLEDGKIQSISDFSDDPVALSAALVIDTGLGQESLDAIEASIPAMVAAFSLFDEVAVYRYDNEVFQVLDFVENPIMLDSERLREALDAFVGRRRTIQSSEARGNRLPPPSPVINGIETIPRARVPSAPSRRVLHDAIYTAARDLALRADDRRRTIIVITDGTDVRSEVEAEEVRLAPLDADIQVYPLGLNMGWFTRLTDSLDDYAEITGGNLYYRNNNSLQGAYSDITTQARNQYLLTYVSNNPIPDDSMPFREIEIRGNPDYDIDHRFGYLQVP